MTDPLDLRVEQAIREHRQEMQRALELRKQLGATIEEMRRRRSDYYNALAELGDTAELCCMRREQSG